MSQETGFATSTSRSALRPAAAVSTILAAILLLAALLGLGWLHVAANPAGPTPELTFDFGGLRTLTDTPGVPTNWIQRNFFAWIGWVLFVVAVLAGVATFLTKARAASALAVAASVLGLLTQIFALKGVLTWGGFFDTVPDARAGVYTMAIGFLILLGLGVVGVRVRRD